MKNINNIFDRILESELNYDGCPFQKNDNRFRNGENIKPKVKGTPHFGTSAQKQPSSNPAASTTRRDYTADYSKSGSLTESAKRLHIVPHTSKSKPHEYLFESIKEQKELRKLVETGIIKKEDLNYFK